MAQSSGRCRGDYGRREPVQRKTTRMSGFTAGRRAFLLIGVCGACGSIILKRDMRLVAMNEMRVVEMRQEEEIPNGAVEADNGATMTRVFAPHESVHCASSSFSVAATRTRPRFVCCHDTLL